uniref:Piwi domain-containing protein n=1 Tax=Onchocerca volvulus TaxID=6282 RepID=A0A8R1TMB6_ONCVO
MSSLLQRFDYGKVGARIPLIANYYEIKINREIYVHRYEVIIKDPTKDRRLDRSISNKYYPFGRSIYIISDQNRKWKVPIGGEIEAWTELHGSVKINSVEHALFNADGNFVEEFLHKNPNDPDDQGNEVTVEEYFAQYKEIRLNFPHLPGAVMELEMQKERICSIIADRKLYSDIFLQNFGVWISPDMIHLEGRVLNPPKLELHKSEMVNGLFEMCLHPSPTNILFGVGSVSQSDNGVHFIWHEIFCNRSDSDEMERRRLRRVTVRIIKTICDLEEGIACQVILMRIFRNMSSRPETNVTAHNIILEMNTKLGGMNNKVHQDYNMRILILSSWPKFSDRDDPTIFIGVNLTHSRPGKLGHSIASVVGSTNLDATRYETSIKVQHPKMERIVYFVDALRERPLAF